MPPSPRRGEGKDEGVNSMTRNKLTPLARNLRATKTDAERRLWYKLRNRRLSGVKFVRQEIIAGYITDFCARSHKLVIELDGSQHGTDGALIADAARTQALENVGYKVIRFWDRRVIEEMDDVIEMVLHELSIARNE
jgi:very-short-patch-repair endonuclease